MESYGNERQVQQGEDWNLDILLSGSNVEYVPYLISNMINNPFFVITIASTKYEKNLRYVKSWWCEISDNPNSVGYVPRFFQTTPEDDGEYEGLASLPSQPRVGQEPIVNNIRHNKLYRYTLTNDEIIPELGHKKWYYYYFQYTNYGPSGNVIKRVDIVTEEDCFPRVRYNFLSRDTSEWGSQNYLYQITLVGGQLMADRLNEIYIAHGKPENWPATIEAQYAYVKANWPKELQPDIDVDSPLGYIESPEPVLTPTKLEVFNNLRTII